MTATLPHRQALWKRRFEHSDIKPQLGQSFLMPIHVRLVLDLHRLGVILLVHQQRHTPHRQKVADSSIAGEAVDGVVDDVSMRLVSSDLGTFAGQAKLADPSFNYVDTRRHPPEIGSHLGHFLLFNEPLNCHLDCGFKDAADNLHEFHRFSKGVVYHYRVYR